MLRHRLFTLVDEAGIKPGTILLWPHVFAAFRDDPAIARDTTINALEDEGWLRVVGAGYQGHIEWLGDPSAREQGSPRRPSR